ncbi:hypothetical protein L1987_07007 [Smallanthus sonchifolius]|uniref:Uncharacterized protein n=1 Tax=Smallanthus sonchifolius TaxID=185202 RepID=A0ACB9JZU9_9ASTR|nr:hypothetical protein L1987_07007 [Smallanthus sonchifolius]
MLYSNFTNTSTSPIQLWSDDEEQILNSVDELDREECSFEKDMNIMNRKKDGKEGEKSKSTKVDLNPNLNLNPETEEYYSIRNRYSPKQLYKAISVMNDKQKETINLMGFGKLLKIKLDGIPQKMGHYVADKFDESIMGLRLPRGIMRVSEHSIYHLLGILNCGIDLKDITLKNQLDPTFVNWRNTYENDYISPGEIVSRISEDVDDYSVLKCLSIEIENYNWCAHVVRCIKNCKLDWESNKPMPFKGALSILTLMYVDYVTCNGMKVDWTVSPIEFWNVNRLKQREALEITTGGFGKGELIGMFVSIVREKKKDNDEEPTINITHRSLVVNIKKMEDMLTWCDV